MKFIVVTLLVLLFLIPFVGHAAAPTCTPPEVLTEYHLRVVPPKNATEKCIALAERYAGPQSFYFENGEFDFEGSDADGYRQETSKNKCDVLVALTFPDDVRFLVLRFDRSWYRGQGAIVEDGCTLPLKFVRD